MKRTNYGYETETTINKATSHILTAPHLRWFETADQTSFYTLIERHTTKRPLLEKLESSLQEIGLKFNTIRGVDVSFKDKKTLNCYLVAVDKDSFINVLGHPDCVKLTSLVIHENKLVSIHQMQKVQVTQDLMETLPSQESTKRLKIEEETPNTAPNTLPPKKRWSREWHEKNQSTSQGNQGSTQGSGIYF